ncbi:hypothetical protein VTJ83DRAFT_4459 [Remersonia thermophila]|uniref:Uncharacterized protein n=1 Tax=Remersonia thermophila TaxID=72144 RepID=A0ABR4DC56_9PEZI
MPSNTFSITAAPGTDIWRKPPTTNVFNAPTALPSSPSGAALRTAGPLASFRSARLSFNFAPAAQYDQAGLLLSFRRRGDAGAAPPAKWIKTGVELYNARPRLSTVSCDSWADWSVADLHPAAAAAAAATGAGQEEIGWTTVLVEKDKDGNGTGVWVYRLVRNAETGEEEKVPLREICWVFGLEKLEEWEVDVSAMAARPEKGVAEGLVAEFGGLEVKWAE